MLSRSLKPPSTCSLLNSFSLETGIEGVVVDETDGVEPELVVLLQLEGELLAYLAGAYDQGVAHDHVFHAGQVERQWSRVRPSSRRITQENKNMMR